MISSVSIDEADEELKEKVSEELISKGLLASFSSFLVHICRKNFDEKTMTFSTDQLSSNALLALCKYMCCSSTFCEKHINLLFSILGGHSDPDLRANIVICIGDLAFRFPNLVAPWIKYLYKCLLDEDVNVRKNTLMVLTHLILNDMIKIKGQISQIALCTEDNDKKIAEVAKLFFIEALAEKEILCTTFCLI